MNLAPSSNSWACRLTSPAWLAVTWVLLAALYVAGCIMGLRLAIVHPSITAVWPGTGIALAAILVLGYRVWPGIFVGAFVVNVLAPRADGETFRIASGLGIAGGNTLEGLLGAFLVNKFAGGCRALAQPLHILHFVLLGALASPVVSATVGVLSLGTPGAQWPLYWATWWLGDAVGALIVAPPLILWSVPLYVRDWSGWTWIQVAAVSVVLVLVGLIPFWDWPASQERYFPMAFVSLPLIIWVAFALGQRGIATISLLLAVLAMVGMHHIHGSGSAVSQDHWAFLLKEQLQLQTFLALTAVTGLTLAAVVAERNRSESGLREASEKLERRVQARTADLARGNDALRRENYERQQAEQALRASEERVRLIIETAYDAYIGMDAVGLINDWNAQAQTTFGWSRSEALGRSLTELIIPPRHRAHREGLKKFLETGEHPTLNQRVQFEAVHRSGREFPVEMTIWVTLSPENTLLCNAFIHDITERKRAEEKFRGLLESAPDAMVIVNVRGEIVLVNKQTEKMFGYARQDILGKSVDLLVPKGLWGKQRKDLGETRAFANALQRHGRRKDGAEFPVEISLSPLKTEKGTLVSSAIRDITARQEIEEKLRQSERLAAVGEMIAGLAHESRNALQQSQACLELLALKVERWPEIAALVADVQKAQDNLHYLYEEVRGYAAPIKLNRQPTDLWRLLTNIWDQLSLLRQGRQAKLLQQPQGTSPVCSVDPHAFSHVLRNILENSLQACSDPVEIQVSFEAVELNGQPALWLTLIDNGPGLSPEARKKIFQPFFTTKVQGTGLGLAITRRIVEAHQGRITVADNHHGMKILITLPRSAP